MCHFFLPGEDETQIEGFIMSVEGGKEGMYACEGVDTIVWVC